MTGMKNSGHFPVTPRIFQFGFLFSSPEGWKFVGTTMFCVPNVGARTAARFGPMRWCE
jgi:hypothetical protein